MQCYMCFLFGGGGGGGGKRAGRDLISVYLLVLFTVALAMMLRALV